MIEIILPSMQTSAPLTTTAFHSGSQNHLLLNPNAKSTFLAKTFFHGLANGHPFTQISFLHLKSSRAIPARCPRASLIESPVLWAGRVCVFYVLLKTGLAGSSSNPIISSSASDIESGIGDFGITKWLSSFQKNPDKEASDRRKLVSKWHPTTKGTLRRNYRVPSKAEGRRLLKAIAALLSEDDHFVDGSSHKGCQIRRESAHGESVCCNNVRALFDELPTPHLLVEITAFPAGPLTERDYTKAEKLERVLRSSPCV